MSIESQPLSRIRPRSNSTDAAIEPPAQRQRRSGTPIQASSSIVTVPKDEKFFRPDGDCIVQVENTLFKIHRYHLLEDSESSVFQSMFSLPTGSEPSQGQSVEDPIVLSGDTAAQFRAYLSFVYSLPIQTQINRASMDDLPRLTDIIPFAHKYLLQNCLVWALESMKHVLKNSTVLVPEEQYLKVLGATNLCAPTYASICDSISGLLIAEWMAEIRTDLNRIGHALEAAETFHQREFLVDLYTLALEILSAAPDPAALLKAGGSLSGIGTLHQLRIFSGGWLISQSLERFLKAPPNNIHLATCPPQSFCRRVVDAIWRKERLQIATAGSGQNLQTFGAACKKLDRFRSGVVSNLEEYVARTPLPNPCAMVREMNYTFGTFKGTMMDELFTLP
ncbi:BTB domain-containing protein [Favolaschia claudopus]|uniref:BTB domain-containing protein n=1 Tax=Favolaschia claudopus TaxID=2862362 RepID=A0AAW0DLN3_9AGAR